jgi:AbrB family looped-hinge helix DNA binding protein
MGMPVTVKGQVTIPKPIRDRLGLTPGSRVEFEVDANGDVILRRAELGTDALRDRFADLLGCATAGLTTDEIMALTRGED